MALCAVLMTGCDRASSPPDREVKSIDPKKVEPGPIRHANLTGEQMSRVQRVQKIFSEVDPSPLEKWVEDFRRDVNPDRELAIWEEMAKAYETFTTSKSLTPDQKKEVFQVVLMRSAAPADEALKNLDLKILTEKDAREIMAVFTTEPKPIRVTSP